MSKFIQNKSSFHKDVKIDSAKKLYLDGGSDTYIVGEPSISDTMSIFVGGTNIVSIQESTINAVNINDTHLCLDATYRLIFDDTTLGHTYITQSSDDVLDIVVGGDKILSIDETVDSGVTSLKGTLKIKEQADASADTASYGQLWIKNVEPNELYFTTDAGDDIQITDGTALAAGGGGGAKHWMDWWNYGANLATQNYFYADKHNDEYGVSSTINTDLSASGYSTTTLNNGWRMIRYGRRIPYAGDVTKFMVHLESTGAAADSDVEVALWWADALADDTEHASYDNFTCAHLCTLTFDFTAASKHMTKQTTSFNATAVSEGDWFFITLRKITSGDGSYFHCHSTILWE